MRKKAFHALAEIGHFPHCVPNWSTMIHALTAPSTKWLVVDEDLCRDREPFLTKLAKSLNHKPKLYLLSPHRSLIQQHPQFVEHLSKAGSSGHLSDAHIQIIPHLGWGPNGLEYINRVASSHMDIRIQGERGTGKEQFARLIHQVRGTSGPFIRLGPKDLPQLTTAPEPGTVYLEAISRHGLPRITDICDAAKKEGWRIISGGRNPYSEEQEGRGWLKVRLKPLRECPKDLRPLTRLYMNIYRKRLGIPKRQIHGKLWALIDRYTWPGNHRELETFVVQATTSASGSYITPKTLPPEVLDHLSTGYKTAAATQAYERMVEERLRPVVSHFQPSADTVSLYRLVLDATEKALIRLVVTHSGGNQKKAAQRLGVARNTLRSRMERLDPYGENH